MNHTIRISTEAMEMAQELTEGDKIMFPTKKNAIEKGLLLLKQKVEFDKSTTPLQKGNKKEQLKQLKIPSNNNSDKNISSENMSIPPTPSKAKGGGFRSSKETKRGSNK